MKSPLNHFMILNVISTSKGGGAELLVRETHRIYKSRGVYSKTIFFESPEKEFDINEFVLGASIRNPLNILALRNMVKHELKSKENTDIIIFTHLTWPFLYVPIAVIGLPRVSLIFIEHSTTNSRRRIPFFKYIERIFYSRYRAVICISDGVRQSLSKWLGTSFDQTLVTVHNGSRLFSFTDRESIDGRLPHLVSIGSLTKKKNFASAITAVAKIADDVGHYTIVGEGPERDVLEKLVQSLNIENKVTFVGWSDVIEQYLHAADIQIIPSLWEGFGLVAVEGMSTGLPIVASNVDGLRDVLDPDNPAVCLVDDAQSSDAWCAAIQNMIRRIDAQGILYLASHAREQAEQFTLEEMAIRYLEIAETLPHQVGAR